VFYFSDSVTRDCRGDGGTNYLAVQKHIQRNKFSHVAILTDDDTDNMQGKLVLKACWLCAIGAKKTNLASHIEAPYLDEIGNF